MCSRLIMCRTAVKRCHMNQIFPVVILLTSVFYPGVVHRGFLLGLVRSHAVGEAGVGRPGAATFMWETFFHLDCGACVVV